MPDFTTDPRLLSPYVGMCRYSIYQDSGTVKLVDNDTGTVTSYATIGPAIDAVLANTNNPTVEIRTGTYNLASGFTGWVMVSKAMIIGKGLVIINVPQGFTDSVFILSTSSTNLYNVHIVNIFVDEAGSSPTFAWVGIAIAASGSGSVQECRFIDLEFWRANAMIYIHTTNNGWANENYFVRVRGTACKYHTFFEHTETYTLNLSGPNNNHFLDCSFQTTGADPTNHYPQVLGGIVNVLGQWNHFTKCSVWDIAASNSSAPPMTISSNANATVINGGILTPGVNFVDNGTNTQINDEWHGLYNKNTLTQSGNALFTGTVGLTNTLNIAKTAQSSTGENLFSISVSDASGDSFTLGNSSSTDNLFAPFFDSTQGSTAITQNYAGLYFNTRIKSGNDVVPSTPCNIFAAMTTAGNPITTRAIASFLNKWDECYTFYPSYADFTSKGIQNAVLQGISWKVVTKSADATLVDSELIVSVSASGANRTMTLPAASGRTGKIYVIQKSDSSANTVTIDPNSTETINGASTFVLTAQYQSVMIWCDGSNWFTQPNSSERTGKAVASGNGSTTTFTIAHGVGSTPSNVFVDCSSHAIGRTYTVDSTNISITFSSAPSSGTNNVVIYWRAIV